MYKVSPYNHFQSGPNGSRLAFNASTGALAMMTEENYVLYNRIKERLADDPDTEFSAEEQELVKQLEYANFIYKGDYDEIDRLYFTHHQARFDRSSIGFVLAPTMACNMACEYCYEANKKGKMNAETIEAIIDHIERNAGGIDEVSITWYGGEPLLAVDVIEDLTEAIVDIGREHRLKYGSTIITNGYLLDRETVDRLKKLYVAGAQITLDGPAAVHNKKRPLKNGQSSYETIIENMKYASDHLNISVRVNIDSTFTEDMITEMLEDFKRAGLQKKIKIYFGLLEAISTACAAIADNCFNVADYSKIETGFFKILLDNDFEVTKLPSPIGNYCVAQTVSGYVMDHEGYLYQCFNYVGDQRHTVGNIRDKIDFYNGNFLHLFKFDPFVRSDCRDCNILPICMGGCPARRLDREDVDDEEACSSWKHNLPQMLDIIARSRQQQMAAAQSQKEQR